MFPSVGGLRKTCLGPGAVILPADSFISLEMAARKQQLGAD
jgi:hypothetical protein